MNHCLIHGAGDRTGLIECLIDYVSKMDEPDRVEFCRNFKSRHGRESAEAIYLKAKKEIRRRGQ